MPPVLDSALKSNLVPGYLHDSFPRGVEMPSGQVNILELYSYWSCVKFTPNSTWCGMKMSSAGNPERSSITATSDKLRRVFKCRLGAAARSSSTC